MRLPTKSNFIFLSIGLLTGIVIMIFFYHFQKNSTIQLREIRNKSSYKYINPLLECETVGFSQNQNINNIKHLLDNLINDQTDLQNISFASVYYRDLNNGPWLGINEKEFFSPASLIKVPLMMAYYKLAETDPSILLKTIKVTKPYNDGEQNIVPEKKLQIDTDYSTEDLINQMIIYSDNLAYEFLLENIDNSLVYKVYSDLGVDISRAATDPNGNIITVKDYASFFRILFNSSYLEKRSSEKALSLLTQVSYSQALKKAIPINIPVAHKFGERQYLATGEKQLHDCGIIYLPQKPYLLCVMTRSKDFNAAAKTISQISSLVYKEVSKDN